MRSSDPPAPDDEFRLADDLHSHELHQRRVRTASARPLHLGYVRIGGEQYARYVDPVVMDAFDRDTVRGALDVTLGVAGEFHPHSEVEQAALELLRS